MSKYFLTIHKTMRKKCPYSEFSLPAFSRIWTEYLDLQSKSEKCGSEKLRIWTFFMHCFVYCQEIFTHVPALLPLLFLLNNPLRHKA